MSSQPITLDENPKVCVIIGHDIEAITSAVVLASLGQNVHLYADITLLEQQLQQYGFEHHLQALWQLYVEQQKIISRPLLDSADKLIDTYDPLQTSESLQLAGSPQVALYWLFLDSIKSIWVENEWITAFNHSYQQTCPIIISGIEQLGHISALAQRLQRAWVYYVPFVFLQDGEAYSSMLKPSLWLLGEKTADSSQHLSALQPLIQHARAYHHADIATIEFARSSIMAMLATRVSFINEMSRLADSHQVDIQKISQIMGLDQRVGSSYLQAGWGFGGNTLPAELEKLEQSGQENRVDMPLLQAVMHINKDQKELIFRKFWQYFDGFIDNKTVMIWGGSYKAGSGRTEGSAIHPLLELLWSYNIRTLVYSNKAKAELAHRYDEQPLLQLIDSPYQQLGDAQAIFIMSWSPQNKLDITQINNYAMPIFDAQAALSRDQLDLLIGDYVGIGRTK
ncbi:UDP-glucose/GDP-mannose dehydrogenase family protein [Psychrobacter sp. LV10R520-6]|uniref:UDP-glucose/GDP-mannose dehydrogenase family protein n=1 Tax=Psychrobacter sp. LV10R520-6 TaxID=1415574 RepID=UPI0024C90808|nr:UDP-glucose/GDP-mannose dehydrogenase family protein [Psychrobacter sp. LV10R520-6]SNT71228.1 UDPglucose 6-dehydrogenase [Psychrobacter sp. LV10R520-6]